MLGFLKRRRRARLAALPFPEDWARILAANAPAYRRLPGDLRNQLHGHVHIFLAEKTFEGCNGLEITDEIRVTIAGQACLLILNRETDCFPDLITILVYPSMFYADMVEPDEHQQIVSEYTEDRSGESWDVGVVILSWEDIVDYTSTGRAGYNLVLHEFAHQLDLENGAMDGMPRLPDRARRDTWRSVFSEAYARFERATMSNRRTLVDAYGAGDAAEFFAVVTESFFERPLALRREYTALYDELSAFYRVDPASWPLSGGETGTVFHRPRARRRRRGG
ncbi:MAG: zinc-dependent peptidase [Candidatus Krumholzibacteria bacterium]|nr:zinc-dependent peptidase [Candidatus Krumholzibacteria bacterium]MDH4335779.1 zinc-dependent peptidase [Candidatus Krumholzibacteria bacterium]MDH5269305.1 zinc-dependent peptidase [Candidatus Krumholzibacteria bacterium]